MREHNTTPPDSSDLLLSCRDEVAESPVTTLNQILYFILTQLMAHSLFCKVQWLPHKCTHWLSSFWREIQTAEFIQGVSSAQVHMDFHPPRRRCKNCSCTHSTSGRGELAKHLWKADWCASLHQRTEFGFCIAMFCPYRCPMWVEVGELNNYHVFQVFIHSCWGELGFYLFSCNKVLHS